MKVALLQSLMFGMKADFLIREIEIMLIFNWKSLLNVTSSLLK